MRHDATVTEPTDARPNLALSARRRRAPNRSSGPGPGTCIEPARDGMFGVADELPDDVDPRLAFPAARCGGDDYLYDARWHTFPGRIAAYCPTVIRTTGSVLTNCRAIRPTPRGYG